MITKLAGMFGIFQGISFLRNVADEMDNLSKASRRLGVSAEAVQQWSRAAELGGSSIQNVEKAVARMQRSIDDATIGLTSQSRAFSRLGLNAEELRMMLPERQLETVGKALNDMENATERSSVAMQVFGRSGLEMVNVLEALDDQSRILGDRGFLSDKALQRIEKMNDRFTELGQAFKAGAAYFFTEALRFTPEQPGPIGPPERLQAFQQAQSRAMTQANEMMAGLLEKIEKINGATTDQMKLSRLVALGISDDKRKEVQALIDQLDLLEKNTAQMEAMRKHAETMARTLRTPFEVMREEMTQAFALWQKGLIGAELYKRAVAQASQTFRNSQESQTRRDDFSNRNIAAMDRSSSEAFTLVQEAIRGRREQDRVEKEQLEEQRRITAAINDVQRSIENNAIDINEVNF